MIGLVVGFLFFISILSHFSQVRSEGLVADASVSSAEIVVEIRGAVKRPGAYPCLPGTSLKELLKKAGLDSSADKKRVPFKKIFLVSGEVDLPFLPSGEQEICPPEKISLEEK